MKDIGSAQVEVIRLNASDVLTNSTPTVLQIREDLEEDPYRAPERRGLIIIERNDICEESY